MFKIVHHFSNEMADKLNNQSDGNSAEYFVDLMINGTRYNASCVRMDVSDSTLSHSGRANVDDNDRWLCPWNGTWTSQTDSYSFSPSPFFQVIIYSMYSMIFVLALVGNLVVCAVVFTSIRKWTVTNFFIVNMAAGDILMAFFCIPFTFVPTFVLLYWPFGAAMCRLVSFSQAVSVFVSAYTMVAISSDRYLAIVYPLRPRMTRNQAKWIIVAVWLAAVSTAMPTFLFSELIIPENSTWHVDSNHSICTEVWSSLDQQMQYTTVLLVLQYCFPLAVLIFTYGRIGIEIWGKKTPGEAHQHRDLRLARSKRKMIKMMIIVVFFFAFCWFPLNLVLIIGDHYPEIWNWSKINYVFFACHWLALSHSAYNPIIYCCFNSKFRQGFQVLAGRCGCRCLMPENEDQWRGECDCGGRMSGTQESAHGDHGCVQLQRVNTYTTCSGGSISLAQRNSTNSSCRLLLANQQQLLGQNHPHNGQMMRKPSTAHHQSIRNGYSSRFQPHQQQSTDGSNSVGHQRARSCSSCNGAVNTQRRYSPLSSGTMAGCAGSVANKSNGHYNRSRPQKFVFRTNFSTPSSCQQQQQLLSGGAGSPAIIQSDGNNTAESHI